MSDSISLNGKVAIITGAAHGLGAETARLFARRGARLVVADVDPEGQGLVESIGDAARFMHLDVSDEANWQHVVSATLDIFGGLDILVNNAGIFSPGTIRETGSDLFERLFRVNQLGTLLGIKYATDALAASRAPSIVNVSSCVGMRGTTGQSAYAATKWAVRGLTKCAALELAPQRIRVNSVHPGPSDTRIMAPWGEEAIERIRAMIPFGRFGKANETAEAVAFLASDAAAYTSGAELAVDGAVFA